MPKIVLVGAGSTIFAKNVIGDCLLTPSLRESEFALVDIDSTRLERSSQLLSAMNAGLNEGRARFSRHAHHADAMDGADYVITAIQVGGYHPCVVNDFEIPLRYGLRQTYADTLGIGGIFRGLRTIPAMLEIVHDMEQKCPSAVLLNYTNPMAIVMGAIFRKSAVRAVGLCHSVQRCAEELLTPLGESTHGVTALIAGINHQAWLLQLTRDGEDIYPAVRAAALERPVPHDDMVRYEIMKRFGFYVTESSQHSAEYVPYFIRASRPELLEEFGIRTDEYKKWGESQRDYWREQSEAAAGPRRVSHERTAEYASYILDAMERDVPYTINANVQNAGLITNLPREACVEVPCLVDGRGIQPCRVPPLPPQCAALNRTNINAQLLTIEAAVAKEREAIYHAALLDPHTSAELAIHDTIALCDDMIDANRRWIGWLG